MAGVELLEFLISSTEPKLAHLAEWLQQGSGSDRLLECAVSKQTLWGRWEGQLVGEIRLVEIQN